MFALSRNVKSAQFLFGSLNRSNDLAIELLPVGNLAIRTNCQHLVFFSVEKGLLESCGFEHAQETVMLFDVPKNAGTITAGRYSLTVILANLDRPYSATMLLEGNFHDLSLFGDLPDPNFSFSSSRNDSFSVRSDGD